jgi:hypothetical protein
MESIIDNSSSSNFKVDSMGNNSEDDEDLERKLRDVGDNAARNLRIARKDAQMILDQAKERTGIQNTDDLKVLAADMMEVASECIKEFMSGYRKGRDGEIDKMLNEYFKDHVEDIQQQETDRPKDHRQEQKSATKETTVDGSSKDDKDQIIRNQRRRRRRPKHGIPRD